MCISIANVEVARDTRSQMSSTIFYRFRSQRDPSRILFDGTGLTVFDLKREIISENKLGDGTDFQLRLYNPDSMEEYEEDQTVIPRSSSVVARRSPAARSIGAVRAKASSSVVLNNATRYVTGRPRVFAKRAAGSGSGSAVGGGADIGVNQSVNGSEEDRIANMFANQENQWEQTQQEMSAATPVFNRPSHNNNNSNSNSSASMDEGPPPPGYMCYRCGARDHWIKNCPTNNDPNFEGKRIKRTTGIPKKFLKSVEIDPNTMTAEEMAQRKIMITDEGKFVIQVADAHSWEDYQRKQQNRLVDANEMVWSKGHFKDLPDDLKCSITGGLLRDAVNTSKCCHRWCSKTALEDLLLESDFVCPLCGAEDVLLDSLEGSEAKSQEVREFLEREKKGSKGKENGAGGEQAEDNKGNNTDEEPASKKAKLDEEAKNSKPNTMLPPPPPFALPPFPMFPLPFLPMNNSGGNQSNK